MMAHLQNFWEDSSREMGHLREILQSVSTGVDATSYAVSELLRLAGIGEKIKEQRRAVKSLQMDMMNVREDQIGESHMRTFEWIIDNHLGFGFLDWLRSGVGIYWIAGNAGSGKSTLMKFLCAHERTREALHEWSGSRQLVLAKHFFWNFGNTTHSPLHELLQHLLFQVVQQCPPMLKTLCPSRLKGVDHLADLEPWTLDELKSAFSRLRQLDYPDTRFCFFIDGLDEQKQNYHETISLLKDIICTPFCKVCVSSRP